METITFKQQARSIAILILKGFRLHFNYFQNATKNAQALFEQGLIHTHHKICSDRISYYDKRVAETIYLLKTIHPTIKPHHQFWSQVKNYYAYLIQHHPQGELAETFYNSVFCNLFNYQYYHNDNIFIESSLPDKPTVPMASIYDSYFPIHSSIKKIVKQFLRRLNFSIDFENIHRDANNLIKRFTKNTGILSHPIEYLRIDVLKPLFFRNKAAFAIGRVITQTNEYPFIIPLLTKKTEDQQRLVYVDTLITDKKAMITTFGFYHSYFLVKTQTPSAIVKFLQQIIPEKKKAELYSFMGFHKQGKNEFYRDFLNHLELSSDEFEFARGIEGLVMTVINLPSFPYVFKIIKDKFSAVKNITHSEVKKRYLLVKKHDRVGRMADTLEFSNVALPKARFSTRLLNKLRQDIASSLTETKDEIIIHHLYIERRVTPLNVYLHNASQSVKEKVMKEFAQSIKDMMVANIFPGDLLLKNFGITTSGRVIYYDYDEVQYLDDMNFRKIPQAQTFEQEMSHEPWYSVGPNDVFPEEFLTFMTTDPNLQAILKKQSAELFDYQYWQQIKQEIIAGKTHNIYSYPRSTRFEIS